MVCCKEKLSYQAAGMESERRGEGSDDNCRPLSNWSLWSLKARLERNTF